MASITLNHLVKKYGDGFPAVNDVSIDIADGEFIILVGPSGCGKSTLLRMIVGLEDITDGDLLINGQRVNDKAPRDRNLAMVFQNYALYPHLTVYENIAFPLRLAKGKHSEDQVNKLVTEAAATLELTDHLQRKPANLSGGQRQRVAMGRAIVRQADAFLFDEPLSNLDAKLRGQMRSEISQMQRRLGVTSIYVTHDQTEAMTLGDRVAVLKKGELQQIASPRELYEQPVNLFVAGFIGSPSMNFLPATLEGNVLQTALGAIEIPADKARKASGKKVVLVGVRPEFFEDAKLVEDHKRSNGSTFTATLTHTEWLGNEQYGYINFDPAPEMRELLDNLAREMDADELRPQVVVTLDAASRIRGGREAELWLDTRKLHLFDAESGENLTRDAEAGAELTREANEERAEEIATAQQADLDGNGNGSGFSSGTPNRATTGTVDAGAGASGGATAAGGKHAAG
ncbi:sn-glycerol-3-phosphate ABC transporter ATP-binding protein UgpC [Arthrobacter sp. NamB2]|uniref:ABC transporter ATP-binding protein n=1 Tax=Arthrobacter sp. NamB2 TaxID=2576035 RepID=UPI0010C99B30|nr:sn-glycerol-3-phosphate ABC transporter ATP-binding protein UgpC [Arthrobacter sp. NamB2]TKV29281.1 sn-glycerol-3-phosphate ABC transporter ATP-binding protein UgpC [Arthrobacter sp. NamB2]